jgi:hypothetical protein
LGQYTPDGRQITAFEVKEALSRKYLERAAMVVENRRTKEGKRSAVLSERTLPKDRNPQLLRLVLPASVIADFEHAVSIFKLQQFGLNDEREVGYVEFFEHMLECEKKSQQGTGPK